MGVALLLLTGGRWTRLAGVALVVGGAAPLTLIRLPGLGEFASARPLLAALALAALVAILLAGAALIVRWPWLVVVGALVTGLRIPMSSTPSPTDHFVPFWLAIGAGLLALGWRTLRGTQPRARLGAFGYALAAYILLVSASLLWSEGREAGAYAVVAFYLPLGALSAMIGSLDVRDRLPGALATVQIALALVFAGVALFQLHTADLFWNTELIEGNARIGYVRANSLFWDASGLGRFEGLAILTVVGLVALGGRRRSVVAGSAICAVVFAGVALSHSRTGLAMVILGTLLLALAWRPRVAAPLVAVAAIGAVVVLAATGGSGLTPDRLTSSRASIIDEAVTSFLSAPVAGSGLGGFPGPHNVVLGVAAELGAIGLVALAALAATLALAILRPRRPDRDRALRVIATVELVAIVGHSLVDAGLFDDPIAWALASLLATLAADDESAVLL